jgi:hypothetical protein
MNNEELDAPEFPEVQNSLTEGSFNPGVVIKGAAFAAILGLVAALAVTALIGVEWPVRLIMAFHAALSFGIIGAWIAASFAADDEDDTASVHSLPLIVPIPIVSSQGSARDPRTAA